MKDKVFKGVLCHQDVNSLRMVPYTPEELTAIIQDLQGDNERAKATIEGLRPPKNHLLKGDAGTLEVWLDGELLDIKPSQDIVKHSEEFNWGYQGSGPAQLALAVILKLTGKLDGYQDFKRNVIAYLPGGEDFETTFEL